MNIDEPRYDRRVAGVDDLAAGRQHAARDDCGDTPAPHVQVDVPVVRGAHTVEQAADLDDVVARRRRQLPAELRSRRGRRRGRRRRLRADVDAKIARTDGIRGRALERRARGRPPTKRVPWRQRHSSRPSCPRGGASRVSSRPSRLSARGSCSRGRRSSCRRVVPRGGAARARRRSAARACRRASVSRHSSNWPVRSLAKTNDSPSGQKVGSRSTNSSFVRRRGSPRSASQRSPSAVNAVLRPSGELVTPFTPSAERSPGASNGARSAGGTATSTAAAANRWTGSRVGVAMPRRQS